MGAEDNKIDVKANKRTALLAAIALVLLLAAGWLYKINEIQPDNNQSSPIDFSNNTDSDGNDLGTEDKNTASPAIDALDQQIQSNPNDPNLYAEKSNILYNSGDKAAALSAVQDGLQANPDSDLLKSKRDILTKDYFQSDTADTPRQ